VVWGNVSGLIFSVDSNPEGDRRSVAPLIVPVITLARVQIEPLSLSHSQGMFELWSQSRVCEYAGLASDSLGRSIRLPVGSVSESDRLLHFWLDRARAGTGFRWAVVLSETREFIGAVGFNSLGECSEYAYHFVPRWWGRGLAAEASRGALDWSLSHGSSSIEVFISPSNKKSIQLAEQLGFEPTSDLVDDSQRFILSQIE
jgi:ribosomal-protein-alanine N-acetyltransferase